MSKPHVALLVALPASLTADAQNLRQKTVKVGSVGRAIAVFRVDKICIYNDDDPSVKDQVEEVKLMTKLLSYMDAPQYLRKKLFPRIKELRYVGLLPPLRTPHHPLHDERTASGDYREAAVVDSSKRGSLLELGLPEKGVIDERLEPGTRLTVRIGKRLDKVHRSVTRVKREEVGEYWGFKITCAQDLAGGLSKLMADYVIGTSRHGQNSYGQLKEIRNKGFRSLAIAFGGPYRGIFEICKSQNIEPDEIFDIVINTIPDQGVETVRTEEALISTLALLNVIVGR